MDPPGYIIDGLIVDPILSIEVQGDCHDPHQAPVSPDCRFICVIHDMGSVRGVDVRFHKLIHRSDLTYFGFPPCRAGFPVSVLDYSD